MHGHFVPHLIFPIFSYSTNFSLATRVAVIMRFWLIIRLALVTYCVNASLENPIYYFAGNNGTNATRQCKGVAFACNPPAICAVDSLTSKEYCCEPGSDELCIVSSSKCAGEGTNQPSSSQQGCSSGVNQFCCLKDLERCTQKFGTLLPIIHSSTRMASK
jgi:hypothetical protein